MPDLLVLTWNLNENIEAAKLALEHLQSWINDGLYWVAAFQEPPAGIDELPPLKVDFRGLVEISGVVQRQA